MHLLPDETIVIKKSELIAIKNKCHNLAGHAFSAFGCFEMGQFRAANDFKEKLNKSNEELVKELNAIIDKTE